MNKTKDRILSTALHLFNTNGLAQTTLRGIAKEMNISQGNLNYHFKKREDIIEMLYQQLVNNINQTIDNIDPQDLSIKTIHQISSVTLFNFYDYRFFFLDFVHIMREQIKIRTHYNQLVLLRKTQSIAIFQQLVFNGYMRPEQLKNEFENLYTRIQILSDFWMSATSIHKKEITKETTLKYIHIITETLYPYLTPKGIKEYNTFM